MRLHFNKYYTPAGGGSDITFSLGGFSLNISQLNTAPPIKSKTENQ